MARKILLFLISGALVAGAGTASGEPSPPLRVELHPFVGTSFVEVFPQDFTDPASPLAGETQADFMQRISTTPPFVLPVLDQQTGAILAPTGGNVEGEPVFVEMDGRLLVRVEALAESDSPTVPFRFNGLIDNEQARAELEYFEDRPLLGACGRPHVEFPLRYARTDTFPPQDSLTHLTGLDIDGDPTNCAFVDDPQTHEDESQACDAENLPGPDNGADITREDWRPRTPIAELTLGGFLAARGSLLVRSTPSGDAARVRMVAHGLLPEELYTVWEIDTDPLGRPLPQGFPMGGAPGNVFIPDHNGTALFRTSLIHNPIGAELVQAPLPGLPPIPLPAAATVGAVVVWHTNAETNGGLDFNAHVGGGLEGG